MPRIRTIKPEFFDSPGTARASYEARLFFVALWCWADDYGVGTANPKQLVGFAFPNDPVTDTEFPRLCTEVSECYDVEWYEVDGRPFYAIPSWDNHQKNERRAKRRNPGPDKGKRIEHGSSAQTHGTTENKVGKSPIGTGEQGNRGTGEINPSCASDDAPERFDEFWNTYDKKKDRKKAIAKYRLALRKPGVTPDRLITAAAAYITFQKRDGKHPEYTKDPVTWLNNESWTNELPDRRLTAINGHQHHTTEDADPDAWMQPGTFPAEREDYRL